MKCNILAIDPSINNIGIVIYQIKQNTTSIETILIKTKGDTSAKKIFYLTEQLENLLRNNKVDVAVIEEPPKFIRRRGWKNLNTSSIMKLSMAYGCILSVLSRWGIPVEFIPAGKLATKNKARLYLEQVKHIDTSQMSEHEVDALMLVDWYREQKELERRYNG